MPFCGQPKQPTHSSEISSVNTPDTDTRNAHFSMPRHTRTIAGLFWPCSFTLCTARQRRTPFSSARTESTAFPRIRGSIAWFWHSCSPCPSAHTNSACTLPRLKQSVSTNRLIALGLGAASLCFAVLLPTTLWPGPVSMAARCISVLFVLAEPFDHPLGLASSCAQCRPVSSDSATGLLVRELARWLLHRRRSRRTLGRWQTRTFYSQLHSSPWA